MKRLGNILILSCCPIVTCLGFSLSNSSRMRSKPPTRHVPLFSHHHDPCLGHPSKNNDYYITSKQELNSQTRRSVSGNHHRHDRHNDHRIISQSRNQFLKGIPTAAAVLVLFLTTGASTMSRPLSLPANAAEDSSSNENSIDEIRTFTKIQTATSKDARQAFAYTLKLPGPYRTTRKPLPTHLDEVNLVTIPTNNDSESNNKNQKNEEEDNSSSASIKGYSYGITVDPIRISSLKEFGTPNEVAAKIVMAELRRDGVLDVTMGRDPSEDPSTGAYDVEYVSDGTRGMKHYVTRTIVKDQKLYVLTVQCPEKDWKKVEEEVWDSVGTFQVLDGTHSNR